MNVSILPTASFSVKNCSVASIATGLTASSLLELKDKLLLIDERCFYHHFWAGRMNPQFVHPQFHNDFACWVHLRLHDHVLAERLGIIDPTEFDTIEDLRQEVVETIEKRLDEFDVVFWTKKQDRFHFISSTIIIFEGSTIINTPKELVTMIEKLSPSSIFYHFIDARSRTHEKIDDISAWLKIFGHSYDVLIENIQMIDPYFLSLTQLKNELIKVVRDYFNERDNDV